MKTTISPELTIDWVELRHNIRWLDVMPDSPDKKAVIKFLETIQDHSPELADPPPIISPRASRYAVEVRECFTYTIQLIANDRAEAAIQAIEWIKENGADAQLSDEKYHTGTRAEIEKDIVHIVRLGDV